MLFKRKKRLEAISKFFKHIENDVLPEYKESNVSSIIQKQLDNGYELIDNNEGVVAFENLSSELIEYFVILDRQGINLAREVVELFKLDKKWILDLQRINSSGYKKGSWQLVDSEKLGQEFKYTFYKPSRFITDQLKVGNLVKLTFQFISTNAEHPSAERMWVQISEISDGKFRGLLDNHPFYILELYAGDEIEFEHKHIIDHDLEVREPNLVDKYYNRCIVTNRILHENAPINYIYREEPMEKDEDRDYEDTGWRILSGDESQEYMDNPKNLSFVSLGAVLNHDDSFIELLESKIGASFERDDDGNFNLILE
jgi:hypothetical protein